MAQILIVDDSIIMRRNLKVILTQAGHTVVGEAANGRDALAEYEKCKPEIVTMDITMPVMSGIEAVKRIIKSYPDAKIVMISALDQRNMVFDALENGAKHYVIKPITAEKVLTVIDAVINESEEYTVDSDGQVEAAETKVDYVSKAEPPFLIENKDGKFVVTINTDLNGEDLNSIETAVNGLLFIKPLKVAFDFGELQVLSNDSADRLLAVINRIKAVEGVVEIASGSEVLKQLLSSKDSGISFLG